MTDKNDQSSRGGIFAGEDPVALASEWLAEAEATEPVDANAMSLATVDAGGVPNVRIVLLKEIEQAQKGGGFLFYTNYESAKGQELAASGQAAGLLYWKSLGRQVRLRGPVSREDGAKADAYYRSRPLGSRHGAWASHQSQEIASREQLITRVSEIERRFGDNPPRPPHWGGYRIIPLEIEFWANGEYRLHDRFRWTRSAPSGLWNIARLSP
ncbi:pyridoxamine 5'-phosphate oxidase [Aestuariibius sp. 2305UL40-4]|uniref:pyridoxamine 5'-phosphate oxidase n=1 Tax=Aestuariibius violaceus TaxID=3234132 RepID=UPI00345E666F